MSETEKLQSELNHLRDKTDRLMRDNKRLSEKKSKVRFTGTQFFYINRNGVYYPVTILEPAVNHLCKIEVWATKERFSVLADELLGPDSMAARLRAAEGAAYALRTHVHRLEQENWFLKKQVAELSTPAELDG